MTNTTNATPALTDTQRTRYEALLAAGHDSQRALRAAQLTIGSSEGKRGPRAPFIRVR